MTSQNPLLTQDQQLVGDIYTSTEPMANLAVLCDEFGSRFAGTPGEQQAAEFLKARLEAYGLQNVHLEPIPYLGWQRNTATLQVTSPIQRSIPCISLPHSPASQIETTLIDLEDGAPADFDRRADEIAGNIVMTNSVTQPRGTLRWIHRNEKYGRSMMAGAAGFIFVNHYPAYGPATGGIGHKDQPGLIPAIALSKEDGAFLQRLVARYGKITLRITTTDHLKPMTSWNVIGDLPGSTQPDTVVMLGSHYDGHDIAQGAEDPASGTVAVLEVARVLTKYAAPLPCTVRFAFWGIEEIGLLGSTAYVKTHTDQLDNVRFYLNMDSAGASARKDIVLNEWDALESTFVRWSHEMALDFRIGQSFMAHSDHYSFFMEGVPTGGIQAVGVTFEGRGYGHTHFDTLDKVSLAGVRDASALAARLALRLAGHSAWPVTRRSLQAVQALLNSPAYQEEVEFNVHLDEFYAAQSNK